MIRLPAGITLAAPLLPWRNNCKLNFASILLAFLSQELVVVLERHTRGGGVDRTRTLSAGPLPPLATQPVSPAAGESGTGS